MAQNIQTEIKVTGIGYHFLLIFRNMSSRTKYRSFTMTDNTDQENKRIKPRWLPTSAVSVFKEGDTVCLGQLSNCSDSGVKIATYERMEPGSRLMLNVVDNSPKLANYRSGVCEIEIVWSGDLVSSMYEHGCKVTQKSDMFQNMIDSYQEAAS